MTFTPGARGGASMATLAQRDACRQERDALIERILAKNSHITRSTARDGVLRMPMQRVRRLLRKTA